MAQVELRAVTKTFGKTTALDGVNLTIKDGEFFVLLGASGAGKSTAISIVSGITAPTRGQVFISGVDVTAEFPQNRNVATAFESYALYPHLTVYGNLLFPLEAPARKSATTKESRDKRVREIASLLGVEDLLERYPRELSGGQKQRVALGRTLVRHPQIFLLDEPIAHLDAKLRHRMRAELKKIQRESGISTLYATPDQLEALSMGDTVAVLNKGKVEQVGTPDEIYYQPVNLYVAQFVGEPPMNIFRASLQGAYATILCSSPFQVEIPPAARKKLEAQAKDCDLLIGVRPRDIRVCPPGDTQSHMTGEVALRDTLGQTSIITVNFEDLSIKAKIDSDTMPDLHARTGLRFDTDQFYYFNAATQLRIG